MMKIIIECDIGNIVAIAGNNGSGNKISLSTVFSIEILSLLIASIVLIEFHRTSNKHQTNLIVMFLMISENRVTELCIVIKCQQVTIITRTEHRDSFIVKVYDH